MINKVRVLVTGVGSPGGPGIVNALKKDSGLFVFGVDMNPEASGRAMCDEFSSIPSASEDGFISKVNDLCDQNNIEVILPLVTKELLKLSTYLEMFRSKGIVVCVSEYRALEVLNDKGALYQHLKSHNIDCPNFRIVCNEKEFIESLALLGYPERPVVMKPCVGNGSRGIRIISETNNGFNMLFNHKPNSLYSKLDPILEAIKGQKIPKVVMSEYLPGEELTIDTHIKDGKVSQMAIRTRDSLNNGISTSGRFIEDIDVRDYILSIVHSFSGLSGPIGFQVKRSSEGKFLLLESNPRLQGTSVAALGVAINFPLLAVRGKCDTTDWDMSLPKGIAFSRYYCETFRNV
jgi:carbamoyl-phosphate synthase large subunit